MIAFILRFLTSGLLKALWKPVAWVLGGLGLWAKATHDERQKAKAEAQKTYIDKRKAMDNADDDFPSDFGVIRDLMRARDPDKR